MGLWLDHADLAAAGHLQHLQDEESDGAGAEHRHPLQHPRLGEIDGMDGHAQRLQHRRIERAQRRRQLDDL